MTMAEQTAIGEFDSIERQFNRDVSKAMDQWVAQVTMLNTDSVADKVRMSIDAARQASGNFDPAKVKLRMSKAAYEELKKESTFITSRIGDPLGAVSKYHGIDIEVSDLVPTDKVIIVPKDPLPPLGVAPVNPAVRTTNVMLKKLSMNVVLKHQESVSIQHEFAGIDYIVQVFTTLGGMDIPGLTIARYSQSVHLHWELNDASPVEDPTINATVVMIG